MKKAKSWAAMALFLLFATLSAAAQDAPLTARLYSQARMPRAVGHGQFSGIAYLGADCYAVVDDKLPGGGIVFMEFRMDSYGRVTKTVPYGTSGSTVSGRDNEGVAYVPATRTLYVSSESDQQIREYGLDGLETGRQLRVPEAFGTAKISPNKGFEALTYNAATGLFWTTTEAPLKGETFHRLQSFSSEGEPLGSYRYQMEAATGQAAGAEAYVFGIPALAAMDDGRVLVLEREVYVPAGGLLDKALRSFTRMNLFVVDPKTAAPDGLLAKQRVASWSTSSVNLANFEGMCLGPKLSDGRQCLVLIADSQGGQDGLTAEYIKVITLR